MDRETTERTFRWLGLGVVVMCLAGFGLSRGIDDVRVFF